MITRTKGVGFYGKVRIPTIGHAAVVNTAKDIAAKSGAKLHVALSGADHPLPKALKKEHAQALFDHPVETHHKSVVHFLSNMSKKHDDFTLVAGQDRAEEYKAMLKKWNGKKDSQGNVPFHFKKWRVHSIPRQDAAASNRDPQRMSPKELVSSVSATKVEALAKSGSYDRFKAYYPGMHERHVKKLYNQIRTSNSIRESLEVPAIGQTLSRKLMPQFPKKHVKDFLKYLDNQGIAHKQKNIDTSKLKSTQSEFDAEKINSLMQKKEDNDAILVSNDDHVLDGHHRWLADHNRSRGRTTSNAHVVDLPILDLLSLSKQYVSTLSEDTTRKEFVPLVKSFLEFACSKLGIQNTPKLKFQPDGDRSFGGYVPSDNSIVLVSKNRHPMDIFRTLAHELVHHKQNEDGRIGDVATSGATGSDIENEANAEAGKLMRWWAKENPHHFKMSSLVEHTAIFVVGGPCSGKDKLIKQLNEEYGLKELDAQYILSGKPILSEQIIVNGSAENLEDIVRINDILKENNYHTSMIYVNTTNEISKLRNEEREKRGQRVMNESIRFSKFMSAQNNIEKFKTLFGENMTKINNSKEINKDFEKLLQENNSKPKDREWGTKSLTKIYSKETPGSTQASLKKMIAKRETLNYTDTNPGDVGSGIGPTYGQKSVGFSGLAEWASNPETIAKFEKRYGNNAQQKLDEVVAQLSESTTKISKPKSFSSIRESFDKGLLDRRGTVPDQGPGNSDSIGEDRPPKKSKWYKPKAKKQ